MIRKLLGYTFALCLAASMACAGTVVTGTTTTTLPICTSGQFLTSTDGATFTCATPAAGTTVTVSAGPGIVVSGGPAYTVGVSYPIATKTASYAVVATDGAKTLVYNSATAGTFTFPAATTAGFGNGWAACVLNRGAGALTLATATSIFYGGPVVLNKDQSECVQADDGGNWALVTGVSPVTINPNQFQ